MLTFNRMARPAGILLRFGPYYTDEENVPPLFNNKSSGADKG